MQNHIPNIANVLADPSQLGGHSDPDIQKVNSKYRDRYIKYIKEHGTIPLAVYTRKRGNAVQEVYYHALIRSEGNDEVVYDVVIMLYATKMDMMLEPSFKNYFVKIFSNSPAFTFRYAYLYNKYKVLPDELEYKFSKMTLHNPPIKSNPKQYIGIDSTVFFTLSYLMEHQELLYRKGISEIVKDISKFDMTTVPTPDEVIERRTKQSLGGMKKLERTIKSIIRKPKNILFGGKSQGARKATGATKPVAARKAKKATKALKPRKPR
jgi:hypothetical protein